MANLNNAVAKAGLPLLAISAALIAIVWVWHVFTQKTPSTFDPNHQLPTFGKKARLFAVGLAVLSFVPVWLAMRPKPVFALPQFDIIIWNHREADIAVEPVGQFYITISSSPVMESQLASGKFQLGTGTEDIHISPAKSVSVRATFIASPLYEAFYRRGNLDIRYILKTRDGRLLPSKTIPFQKVWIVGEPIAFSAVPDPPPPP